MDRKKYKVTHEFRAKPVDDPTRSRSIHRGEIIWLDEPKGKPDTVVFEIDNVQFQAERTEFFALPVEPAI
jgi:hypothetical protein